MGERPLAERVARGISERIDELKSQSFGTAAPPSGMPEWLLALAQPY